MRVWEALRDGAVPLDAVMGEAAGRLAAAFLAEPGARLGDDYAQLFAGREAACASPYGSVWLDDGAPMMGDSTMAVLQHYENGGFEVDRGFGDLPDHIAVELEYLHVLLAREADAVGREDAATARGATELRTRFLAEHLGAWIAPFAAAVRDRAGSAFYRELASFAERFVAMESVRRES